MSDSFERGSLGGAPASTDLPGLSAAAGVRSISEVQLSLPDIRKPLKIPEGRRTPLKAPFVKSEVGKPKYLTAVIRTWISKIAPRDDVDILQR